MWWVLRRYAGMGPVMGGVVGLIAAVAIAPGPAAGQEVPPSAEPGRQTRQQLPDAVRRPPVERPDPVGDPTPDTAPDTGPADAVVGPSFVLSGIDLTGVSVYPLSELRPLYQDFIGQTVSIRELDEITQRLQRKYRNDGYIITRVIVPPRAEPIDPAGARITVQVVEAYIDRIDYDLTFEELRGAARVKRILEKIPRRCRRGDTAPPDRPCPLHKSVLERYLLLANDLAGVTVEAVLTKSTTQGAANLYVEAKPRLFDVQGSVNNRANDFLGPLNAVTTVGLNNLTGLNDRLQLNARVSGDFDELISLNATEQIPLTSEGTSVTLLGSYLEARPDVPGQTVFSQSVQGAVIVTHPVIRSRARNLFVSGLLNVVDSNLDVNGIASFRDRLAVFRLRTVFDFTDPWGINLFSAEVSQGVDIFDASEAGDLTSREGADGTFTTFTLEASRLQRITGRLALLLAAKAQLSLDNVLSSEEFTLGGERFGRGFDPSEITGDQGGAATVELQYGWQPGYKYLQGLQVYAFSDAGHVFNVDEDLTLTLDDNSEDDTLVSAGGGVRFNFTPWMSGFAEVAVPLEGTIASTGESDPQIFFGASLRY